MSIRATERMSTNQIETEPNQFQQMKSSISPESGSNKKQKHNWKYPFDNSIRSVREDWVFVLFGRNRLICIS